MKPKDLVEIEWFDTFTLSYGWAEEDSYIEDADEVVCRSIGYVLAINKHRVVLVQSHGVGKVSQAIIIPRVNIRRVKVLKGLK